MHCVEREKYRLEVEAKHLDNSADIDLWWNRMYSTRSHRVRQMKAVYILSKAMLFHGRMA